MGPEPTPTAQVQDRQVGPEVIQKWGQKLTREANHWFSAAAGASGAARGKVAAWCAVAGDGSWRLAGLSQWLGAQAVAVLTMTPETKDEPGTPDDAEKEEEHSQERPEDHSRGQWRQQRTQPPRVLHSCPGTRRSRLARRLALPARHRCPLSSGPSASGQARSGREAVPLSAAPQPGSQAGPAKFFARGADLRGPGQTADCPWLLIPVVAADPQADCILPTTAPPITRSSPAQTNLISTCGGHSRTAATPTLAQVSTPRLNVKARSPSRNSSSPDSKQNVSVWSLCACDSGPPPGATVPSMKPSSPPVRGRDRDM